MKIEQYIPYFLMSNKSISLEGIGKLNLIKSIDYTDGENEPILFPDDAIEFTFDKKASTDHNFVNFIVEKTGKIKSLIASDIESYMLVGKQFLNIGKPLIIKGIGTIIKNKQGQYEFIPGESVIEIIDTNPGKNRQKNEIDFSSPAPSKQINNWLKNAIIISSLIIPVIIVFIINQQKQNHNNQITNNADSTSTLSPKKTTDDQKANQKPINFMVILETTNRKSSADSLLSNYIFNGHNAMILHEDSLNYKIVIPFNNSLQDSMYIKDSLQKIFKRSLQIVLKSNN